MTQNFVYGPSNSLKIVESLAKKGLPSMGFFESLRNFRRFKGIVEKNINFADVFYVQPFSDKVAFPIDGVNSHTMNSLFTGDNSNSCVDAYGIRVYAINPQNKVMARASRVIWEVGSSDTLADKFANEVAVKYGKVSVVDYCKEGENGLFSIYYPSVKGSCLASTISREQGEEAFEKNVDSFLRGIYRNEIGSLIS